MSDVVDVATEIEQARVDHLLKTRKLPSTGLSAIECSECGFDIEQKRREVLPGIDTCIECATLSATQNRFRNGGIR